MSNDLYQAAIVAAAKAAHGKGRLAAPDRTAMLDNPLCGDRVTIDVKIDGDRISALGHDVRGCALCQAAASLLADAAPGLTTDEAAALPAAIDALLADGVAPHGALAAAAMFAPVRAHRSRFECVRLPFAALTAALAGG